MKPGVVVAHRGLQRLYPENTRASVLAALDAGLTHVEIDVQLSADGVPVLHHDPDLLRLSGRPGDLRRRTWAQLRRTAVPEPGRFGRRYAALRLASLAQLAGDLALRHGFTLFVELKEESIRPFGRERMLAAVAAALRPIHPRCVLISFDLPVLSLARQATRFPVGPVLRRLDQLRLPAFRAMKPDWVFCSSTLLPKQGRLDGLFGRARSCVYEMPEAAKARALFARGIHAVETFRSDSLAQELALYR
ncbi:MAG TPA: glycerophosphodiester phosphodiesterase family protein [bacterium]|jgi:glycerophosphoryl diester phosphodiesterase|nr:glycerophosphodiester phosphodiesterase family protein [bacterium]